MSAPIWNPPTIRAVAVGAPPGAIDLSLGVPSWPLHHTAREAITRELAEPVACGYGPNDGLPELVEAIAVHHGRPGREVMTSSGSQAALFALFAAHLRPGHYVLMPDPGFPGYRALTAQHGGSLAHYRLAPDGSLDAAAFASALEELPEGSTVDIAMLNHPSNPTGAGASAQALAEVAELCASRGILLISDEVYRELHLGPRQISLHEITDTGVVVSSVSKAWGAPGLRVGWALGAADLLAPARTVHAAMCTAAARPSQLAAVALLQHSDEVLEDSWRHLVDRWSVAQTAPAVVRAHRTPVGGFYHWLALPSWAKDDPAGFCRRVRDEAAVIVVPGEVFGPSSTMFARISCGGDPARLAEGLARLEPWWTAPPGDGEGASPNRVGTERDGLQIPNDLSDLTGSIIPISGATR